MSNLYPLWVFEPDREGYKDQHHGVFRVVLLASSFMVLVRSGHCTLPQLKAFIDMLIRQPKTGKLRKILQGKIPELCVGRSDDFRYESLSHQYFVECMRLETDDPLPVDDIPLVDNELVEPLSPAAAILYDEIISQIMAQMWQVLYRAAAREREELRAMKGKGKDIDMGEEAGMEDATENEEEWGEEAMARMKNSAIDSLTEDDMAFGMSQMETQAWSQAVKVKTKEIRQEEMVVNKLKQLINPLMKQETYMGTRFKEIANIEKGSHGFMSRVQRLGSSWDLEDEEEKTDEFIDGMENEEKTRRTKDKKGKKQANKQKRR